MRLAQKCEGERPNLSVINLGLMTWPWFLKRQANFLPRVVFPGNVYHPQAVDGFASEHFLDANLDLFDNVVLCGNLPKWESMPAPPAYGFKVILSIGDPDDFLADGDERRLGCMECVH